MSTLAALPAFEADAKSVEAARVAVLAWGKAADKADGLSITMGSAIKAAWPLRDQANKGTIRGWLVEAATASKGADWGKIYNAPAPANPTGTEWKRAHNLIDNRLRLAIEAAYPAGVAMIDAGLSDMRADLIGSIVNPLPGYVATNVERALDAVR